MAARNLVIVIFPALAAAALSLSAQVPDDLSQARALERQFEKIIADAEPSIACILVSRNSTYRKFCPQRALAETPALNKSFDFYKRAGELGRPDSVDRAEGLTEDQRAKLKNEINLKNPTIVPESFGSGIVIDPGKGLILTNFHVVRDAVLVYVRLPEGKGGYANIYAADPRSDLAVLKIDPVHTKGIKQPIRFGDAAKLRRGQFVLTLANPYAAGFRDGQPSTPGASSAIFGGGHRYCSRKRSGSRLSITTAPFCSWTPGSISAAAAEPCSTCAARWSA